LSFVIAVAGKGGIGKTTITGLMIRALKRRGNVPILAVDADSNVNLAETIGFPQGKTVGAVRENFSSDISNMPPGMAKETLLELKLNEGLIEGEGVDVGLGVGEGLGVGVGVGVDAPAHPRLVITSNNKRITVIQENFLFILPPRFF